MMSRHARQGRRMTQAVMHATADPRQTEINRQEALNRAKTGQSFANYPAIIEGFMAKGLAASEIEPRVNVFTYEAWKAQGRQVRRGEHGVRVATMVEMTKRDEKTGQEETFTRPWSTTVFHVSQTDPMDQPPITEDPKAGSTIPRTSSISTSSPTQHTASHSGCQTAMSRTTTVSGFLVGGNGGSRDHRTHLDSRRDPGRP